MVALEFTDVKIIKRNGNLYNETIQILEGFYLPLYAEFTPDSQYLYITQRSGLTRVLERNSTDLWEEKIEIDLDNPGGFGTNAGCINHNHTKVLTHSQGVWQEFSIDVDDANAITEIDNGKLGENIFGMQYRADSGKILIYR